MKRQITTILNHSLPRSIAALIAMSSFASAIANADEPVYTMTTIIDAAYGEQVVAGQYEKAIENLTATNNRSEAFFKANNLCVAYTKIGNFDDAAIVCDAAIEAAKELGVERRGQIAKRFQAKTKRSYLAISLTNRGVLHAVMGEVELAHQDFTDALSLDEDTKVAKINLARLGDIVATTA